MAQAKIYWDMENYGSVEKVLDRTVNIFWSLSTHSIRTYTCVDFP